MAIKIRWNPLHSRLLNLGGYRFQLFLSSLIDNADLLQESGILESRKCNTRIDKN